MIKITRVDIGNEYYPERLKKISNPPQSIYVVGNMDILNCMGIAVIGSRKNTEYGEKWCKYFTEKLLEYDLCIISGMALGIDSIAHKSCIENKGKTIAVLPSGFNNIYPKENKELFENIIRNGGAVISEYEPNTNKTPQYCIQRNRLVSGLAMGTLVIEARVNSGANITAKYTKQQGKEVFCVPSSLDNRKGMGTNYLIKKGAKLVNQIEDIISEYDVLEKIRPKKIIKNRTIEKEYISLYNSIDSEPISIEKLIKKSGLPTNEVFSKITMMELEGYVKLIPGNKIVKI